MIHRASVPFSLDFVLFYTRIDLPLEGACFFNSLLYGTLDADDAIEMRALDEFRR